MPEFLLVESGHAHDDLWAALRWAVFRNGLKLFVPFRSVSFRVVPFATEFVPEEQGER